MKKYFIILSLLMIFSLVSCTTPKETSSTPQETSKPIPKVISFGTIYNAFEKNPIRAKDKYTGNRYTITAKINGIGNGGGILNFSGSYHLTMVKKVGKTNIFFFATFEKDQKTTLKKINVGDTITFTGTCGNSAGRWNYCELT